MTMHRTLILWTGLTALAASSAFAQTVSNTTTSQPGSSFEKLTPAQKEAKKADMKEKLKSMTPQERQKFRAEKKAEWQKRYDSASPEKQAKMKERMEQRQAARQAKHGGSPTAPAQ